MSLCIITKCCSFLSCNCGGLVGTIHLVHSWLTQLHDTFKCIINYHVNIHYHVNFHGII